MPASRILMGVIGRPYGVRGLVRVHAYTAEATDLPAYGPFDDGSGRRLALRWRGDGIAEVSEIVAGAAVPVADRTAADKLVNTRLYLDRADLPPPDEDEFYLSDLQGLRAVAEDGREIGTVSAVHDHGGGVYLEIGPLLLPFTRACVPDVDVAGGRLTVVPPAEGVVAEDRKDTAA